MKIVITLTDSDLNKNNLTCSYEDLTINHFKPYVSKFITKEATEIIFKGKSYHKILKNKHINLVI